MSDHRVKRSAESLWSEPRTCRKRRKCDGHLAIERHFIEVGEPIIWTALPPDSEYGNERWWHMAFCAECAPEPVQPKRSE